MIFSAVNDEPVISIDVIAVHSLTSREVIPQFVRERFVRAVFEKNNSVSSADEMDSVGCFFHILSSVEKHPNELTYLLVFAKYYQLLFDK